MRNADMARPNAAAVTLAAGEDDREIAYNHTFCPHR